MKIEENEIPSLVKQGKSQEAISFLYKKVYPQVKRYIVSNNGSKDDALDAFQEAMVAFYNAVLSNKFDVDKYNVFGYVYRVSLNRWLNKIRKDKHIVFEDDMHHYDLEANQELPLKNEEENYLKTLFSGIGEKCIELLTCTIFYDMLMEDVAIRLNYPSITAARMQQVRCKQKLMDEMEKNPMLLKKIKGT